MNKAELKIEMIKHDDNQEKLAEALDLPISGMNGRINGKIEFRAREISKIIRRYRLTPERAMTIFFEGTAS